MAAKLDCESDDICVLRISGVLKRSEFGAEQSALALKIDTGAKPRLLAILENFEGWEHGADWNDLDFLISHSGEIAKIAVVAEPRWEVQGLAFAGAEVRRAPVKFFRLTNSRRREAGWRNEPPLNCEMPDHRCSVGGGCDGGRHFLCDDRCFRERFGADGRGQLDG